MLTLNSNWFGVLQSTKIMPKETYLFDGDFFYHVRSMFDYRPLATGRVEISCSDVQDTQAATLEQIPPIADNCLRASDKLLHYFGKSFGVDTGLFEHAEEWDLLNAVVVTGMEGQQLDRLEKLVANVS